MRSLPFPAFALFAVSSHAADVSFSKQIAPLLTEKCVECHREAKAKGSYRLDTFERLGQPGDSEAPALTAGKPEQSELYNLLVAEDEADRMPKKADPLSAEEIALVKRWIAQGARFDGGDIRRPLSEMNSERLRVASPTKYPRPLPVTALAPSPDGRQLAVSGYGEVLLWDLSSHVRPVKDATGKPLPAPPFSTQLLARIQHLPERIYAIVWPAGSKTLVVAGGTPGRGGEVWLVDVAQGKPVKRLLTTPDSVLCLAVSSDGKMVAVGGTDNHVRLYDLPEGRLRWDVEGHADWVMSLCFSPDQKLLASASRDRTARLFDCAKGEIVTTHTGHEAAVLSVAFSEDGKQVASGSADGQLRVWNQSGDSSKGTGNRPMREGILQLIGLGKRAFLSLADKGAVELSVADRKVTHTYTTGTRVDVLAILAEPPTLITGAHNGEVRLWDLEKNEERGKFVASP